MDVKTATQTTDSWEEWLHRFCTTPIFFSLPEIYWEFDDRNEILAETLLQLWQQKILAIYAYASNRCIF